VDFLAQPLLILGIISTFSIPQVKKLKVLLLPALHGKLKALFRFMKRKDMVFKTEILLLSEKLKE
jgi:hypothetical protein